METSKYTHEIRSENNEQVSKWDFIKAVGDLYRIYYKLLPSEEGLDLPGFHFYALEWMSTETKEDDWGDKTTVEVVFHGVAYFDGIRHLYMGDEQTDNLGYLYYPTIKNLKVLLSKLETLEKTYTRCDYNPLLQTKVSNAQENVVDENLQYVSFDEDIFIDGSIISNIHNNRYVLQYSMQNRYEAYPFHDHKVRLKTGDEVFLIPRKRFNDQTV